MHREKRAKDKLKRILTVEMEGVGNGVEGEGSAEVREPHVEKEGRGEEVVEGGWE